MKKKAYNSSMAIAAWALRHWQYNPTTDRGFPVPAIARALRVDHRTAQKLCEYDRDRDEDPQAIIDALRAVEPMDDTEDMILPDDPPVKDQRPAAEVVRDRMLASLIRATEIIETGLNEAPSISEGLRVAKEYITLLPRVQAVIAGAQGEEDEPEDIDGLIEYLRKQKRQIEERLGALGRAKINIP